VAMVDTNCNPQMIDWPVPSNDDAIRAVRLIAGKIADAIVEGREARAAVMGEVVPGAGLEEGDIEEMPSDLPMMTEEDFMRDEYALDEDEDTGEHADEYREDQGASRKDGRGHNGVQTRSGRRRLDGRCRETPQRMGSGQRGEEGGARDKPGAD